LLQCLNGAGARGDDRRDATSERLGDDQAKRLDSGREYEQIGGIPSLIESRASQRSGNADAIRQSSFCNFMTNSCRVTRIGYVEANQVGRPRKVGKQCESAYQGELVLGGRQGREREQSRESRMLTATRCRRGRHPRSCHSKIRAPVPSAQLGSTPVARANHPRGGAHRLSLQSCVPLAARRVETEFIADR